MFYVYMHASIHTLNGPESLPGSAPSMTTFPRWNGRMTMMNNAEKASWSSFRKDRPNVSETTVKRLNRGEVSTPNVPL